MQDSDNDNGELDASVVRDDEGVLVVNADDDTTAVIDIGDSPEKAAGVLGNEGNVGYGDIGACKGEDVSDRYRDLRTIYHVRAFDFVVDIVPGRYIQDLRPANVALSRGCCAMSGVARSLFVILYRRKLSWHAICARSSAPLRR